MSLDTTLLKDIENFQREEITEYYIYKYLAEKEGGRNREILLKIGEDELRHYKIWREITGKDIEPDWRKIRFYRLLYRIFGLVFSLKLMEMRERRAEERYRLIADKIEIANDILKDEFEHEDELLSLLTDERLQFIGSIVLGLSDALIELTGALAGLSLALYNTLLVGLAALITGIAASMSMAVSEYLSKRSEGDVNAVKGAFYTGLAYILTVLFIVAPYFAGNNVYISLASSILIASIIIGGLTFYTSVVREI
ncbi:TPA: rubrerythrin family protein, partial [Candidatus Geothermarchaeota archaeon]|nr:rubrerythrin family protein [Candidatus Geothermarchaeota archaeon]